jgi:hypothetical protein
MDQPTSPPTSRTTTGALLARFSDAIDTQAWDDLADLLAPAFRGAYVHTGETFDRDAFVALNRDYPGSWRFEREALVDGGDQAVLRARVSDATGASDEVHYVATFAASRDGRLTEITEVWAEVAAPDPTRR